MEQILVDKPMDEIVDVKKHMKTLKIGGLQMSSKDFKRKKEKMRKEEQREQRKISAFRRQQKEERMNHE